MPPHALLERLVAVVPEFGPFWDDPGNCFRGDDGSFNAYGVFAELASFLPERMTLGERAALGALVSECAGRDDDLGNAACTCFIECVAGRPAGAGLLPYLTGCARDYYLRRDEGA
jgi:hypothetical protein